MAIIVTDTFMRKDFVFERAVFISVVYMITLFMYFTILFLVFKVKLG